MPIYIFIIPRLADAGNGAFCAGPKEQQITSWNASCEMFQTKVRITADIERFRPILWGLHAFEYVRI